MLQGFTRAGLTRFAEEVGKNSQRTDRINLTRQGYCYVNGPESPIRGVQIILFHCTWPLRHIFNSEKVKTARGEDHRMFWQFSFCAEVRSGIIVNTLAPHCALITQGQFLPMAVRLDAADRSGGTPSTRNFAETWYLQDRITLKDWVEQCEGEFEIEVISEWWIVICWSDSKEKRNWVKIK